MVAVKTHRSPERLRRRYGPQHDQVGDLHVSRKDPERGTIVLIHGGFWRRHRDLSMTRPAAEAFAELGWNVWNIEYRRGPGTSYRDTLDDCRAAIEHLQVLDDELLIETRTTLLVGHSAGAQLAAWAAADATAVVRRTLTGVLSLNGVLDVAGARDLAIGDNAVDAFIGEDVDTALATVDPARRLPLGVPIRCLHSPDDERVPLSIAEAFCRAATASGDAVELRRIPGAHADPIVPGGPAWTDVVHALDTPWAARLVVGEDRVS